MKQTLQKAFVILFLTLLTGLLQKAKAQSFRESEGGDFKIGIGLEAGKPVGAFKDFFKSNLGASIKLQYDFNEFVSFTLSGGYTKFTSSGTTSTTVDNGDGSTLTTSFSAENLKTIPIKFGIKTYPVPNFYISTEAGPAFAKDDDGTTYNFLVLSPGVGYSTDSGLDVGLRYEHYAVSGIYISTVGLRLAYNLSF